MPQIQRSPAQVPDTILAGKEPWAEAPATIPVGQEPWLGDAGSVISNVKPELHPIMDTKEGGIARVVYKNIANPEQGLQYLKNKFPKLQWSQDSEGEPIVKSPQDDNWKYMDVPGFVNSVKAGPAEMVRDVTDVTSDLASGTATAAGAEAGALAGAGIGAMGGPIAPFTMPAGALIGAVGGGFAGARGAQAVREGVGQAMGMNTMSKDIGTPEAYIGAATAPLFGAARVFSKGPGTVLKDTAGIPDVIKQGIIPYAASKTGTALTEHVLPTIGEIGGGWDKKVLRQAYANLPLINAVKNDPTHTLAANLAGDAKSLLTKSLSQAGDQLSSRFEQNLNTLDSYGKKIPTENILNEFNNVIKQLNDIEINPDSKKEIITTLKDHIARYLAEDQPMATGVYQNVLNIMNGKPLDKVAVKKSIPEYISASSAQFLKKSLNDASDNLGVDLTKTGTISGVDGTTVKGSPSSRVTSALKAAASAANDEIDKLAENVNLKDWMTVKDGYEYLGNLKKDIGSAGNSDAAFERLLKNNSNFQIKKLKANMSGIIGQDVEDLSAKIKAVELFSEPKWQVPNFGSSTTARSLLGAGVGSVVGGAVGMDTGGDAGGYGSRARGAMAGAAIGQLMMSPKAIGAGMRAAKMMESAPQLLERIPLPEDKSYQPLKDEGYQLLKKDRRYQLVKKLEEIYAPENGGYQLRQNIAEKVPLPGNRSIPLLNDKRLLPYLMLGHPEKQPNSTPTK